MSADRRRTVGVLILAASAGLFLVAAELPWIRVGVVIGVAGHPPHKVRVAVDGLHTPSGRFLLAAGVAMAVIAGVIAALPTRRALIALAALPAVEAAGAVGHWSRLLDGFSIDIGPWFGLGGVLVAALGVAVLAAPPPGTRPGAPVRRIAVVAVLTVLVVADLAAGGARQLGGSGSVEPLILAHLGLRSA